MSAPWLSQFSLSMMSSSTKKPNTNRAKTVQVTSYDDDVRTLTLNDKQNTIVAMLTQDCYDKLTKDVDVASLSEYQFSCMKLPIASYHLSTVFACSGGRDITKKSHLRSRPLALHVSNMTKMGADDSEILKIGNSAPIDVNKDPTIVAKIKSFGPDETYRNLIKVLGQTQFPEYKQLPDAEGTFDLPPPPDWYNNRLKCIQTMMSIEQQGLFNVMEDTFDPVEMMNFDNPNQHSSNTLSLIDGKSNTINANKVKLPSPKPMKKAPTPSNVAVVATVNADETQVDSIDTPRIENEKSSLSDQDEDDPSKEVDDDELAAITVMDKDDIDAASPANTKTQDVQPVSVTKGTVEETQVDNDSPLSPSVQLKKPELVLPVPPVLSDTATLEGFGQLKCLKNDSLGEAFPNLAQLTTKYAWVDVYVSLINGRLSFYKNENYERAVPDVLPIARDFCDGSIVNVYSRKKANKDGHRLYVVNADGNEEEILRWSLIEDTNRWVTAITKCIQHTSVLREYKATVAKLRQDFDEAMRVFALHHSRQEQQASNTKSSQRNMSSSSQSQSQSQSRGTKSSTKKKEQGDKSLIDCKIKKLFPGQGEFIGTVQDFTYPYYTINYEDGDQEEMAEDEVREFLINPNLNFTQMHGDTQFTQDEGNINISHDDEDNTTDSATNRRIDDEGNKSDHDTEQEKEVIVVGNEDESDPADSDQMEKLNDILGEEESGKTAPVSKRSIRTRGRSKSNSKGTTESSPILTKGRQSQSLMTNFKKKDGIPSDNDDDDDGGDDGDDGDDDDNLDNLHLDIQPEDTQDDVLHTQPIELFGNGSDRMGDLSEEYAPSSPLTSLKSEKAKKSKIKKRKSVDTTEMASPSKSSRRSFGKGKTTLEALLERQSGLKTAEKSPLKSKSKSRRSSFGSDGKTTRERFEEILAERRKSIDVAEKSPIKSRRSSFGSGGKTTLQALKEQLNERDMMKLYDEEDERNTSPFGINKYNKRQPVLEDSDSDDGGSVAIFKSINKMKKKHKEEEKKRKRLSRSYDTEIDDDVENYYSSNLNTNRTKIKKSKPFMNSFWNKIKAGRERSVKSKR